MCYFSFQSLVKHIPSSIDTNLDTWPPVRGEPTRAYTKFISICQHLLLFQFSDHILVRIHQHYTLVILLLILTLSLIMTFLLPFTRVNALAHLLLSLVLYLIHTCLPPFMFLFILWIHTLFQVCVRSPNNPKSEGRQKEEMMALE